LSEITLNLFYIRSLKAFWAVHNIERNCFAFSKRFETVGDDSREVYEYIFTVILLDEPKSFGVIEPLNFTLCHFPTPLSCFRNFCPEIARNADF